MQNFVWMLRNLKPQQYSAAKLKYCIVHPCWYNPNHILLTLSWPVPAQLQWGETTIILTLLYSEWPKLNGALAILIEFWLFWMQKD